MTEDERHALVMADLLRREQEERLKFRGLFMGPYLAHNLGLIADERQREVLRHEMRKRQIVSANPAPGFNYRHC